MSTDTALKIALAPLLLAQGLRVRARALTLPEAAGPRRGESGNGAPLRLLIVGDSSAAGVGAAAQADALAGQLAEGLAGTHRLHWRLVARTGATTADTIARLETEEAERFDVAVTALGVNDVTHAVPLTRWLDGQARLRALLASRFGVRHVVCSGLPPMGAFPALPQPLRAILGLTARRFDTALARALAPDPRATHVAFNLALAPDLMAEDGFHPSPSGYAVWAQGLVPAIAQAARTSR